MSEKRKPEVVLVAVIRGKRMKLELFPETLWQPIRHGIPARYRVRKDGKWYEPNGFRYWSMSLIMASLRKLICRGNGRRRH
jgi:hypothetical protein